MSPKGKLEKIRTDRVIEPRELLLQISNSANQRLSWHGVDKAGTIPTPQQHAHDSLGSNCRPPERQAQVTWVDPRVHGHFTAGSRALSGNNRVNEQVLPRQTGNVYKQSTVSKNTIALVSVT
jgi:hypothetical protein